MSKFKVGDRVKCVREYPQWLTVGKEYVVTDVYPTPTVCVRGDEGMTGGFNPWYFELAESEKEQPKPEPTVLERVTSRIERSTLIYNYLDTKRDFEAAVTSYNEACQAIRDKLKDGERFVYTRYSEAYIVERDKDGFTVDKIDMV